MPISRVATGFTPRTDRRLASSTQFKMIAGSTRSLQQMDPHANDKKGDPVLEAALLHAL